MKKTASSSKRHYDNSFRAEKSQTLQTQIITSFIKLLNERRGGNVRLQEVAAATGVSERTIFRFFKDKKALCVATNLYLQTHLSTSVADLTDQDIYRFAEECFEKFDRYEEVTLAYIFSPFGLETRERLRMDLCKMLREYIIQEKQFSPTEAAAPEMQAKIATIVSMVNAKLWHDIRTDSNLTGAQIGKSVSWAMRTLVANLK